MAHHNRRRSAARIAMAGGVTCLVMTAIITADMATVRTMSAAFLPAVPAAIIPVASRVGRCNGSQRHHGSQGSSGKGLVEHVGGPPQWS